VAANITLRKKLRETIKDHQDEKAISITRTDPNAKLSTKVILRVPYSKKLCSDNAVMIGVAAELKDIGNEKWNEIKKSDMDRKPRWSVEII